MTLRMIGKLAVGATLAFGLAACATGSTTTATVASASPAVTASPAAPASSAVTVTIQAFQFMPKDVTIKAGGVVTFVNNDAVQHTVSPDSGSSFTEITSIQSGQTKTITFPTAGVQHYHCNIHTSMIGSVTVQ